MKKLARSRRKKEVVPNPLAAVFFHESQYVLCGIEQDLCAEVPEASYDSMLCHDGTVEDESTGEKRRATAAECAVHEQAVFLKFTIDLREDLNAQVSRWLSSVAKRMAKAAKTIGSYPDSRDKKSIRLLMNDPGLLDRMKREELCFGWTMDIVPMEQFSREMKAVRAAEDRHSA